ncbi:O-antigen ligase family protein [Deinococcus sp. MIMF12]|uniref:O-antigen ligase family protein n=1 Tax=Deinococcus rhizophilus TaxID=3049544 RepID=A0ABT7JD74_9DEIO|nr:O-antigen ligase family protein [Deinococcus rhizophilus]MDL2342990.1 O-antigen ligase family protein [Deinococcus rhizophilus]
MLPAAYVLSPLSVLALPWLRRLSPAAKTLLLLYALSQVLPALLAPEPVLATALALGRTLLVFGLMGVGTSLGQTRSFQGVAVGLALVFATALGWSVLGGADLLIGRLGHPYMTPITLGLLGATGVWLSALGGGGWWRLPLGLGSLLVLLLSGSRGALAAALLGLGLGFAVQSGRRLALGLLAGLAVLGAAVTLGSRLDVSTLTRLVSTGTTGRDVVWDQTLEVIQAYPLGGVGSYRLGTFLASPGESCRLWSRPDQTEPSCPAWAEGLGSPWLIAHNGVLQQWAETGPLGVLGLVMLAGSALAAAWTRRDPLGAALLGGLLLTNLSDNTLLVPGPFVGELFWIVAGVQLAHLERAGLREGLTAAGLLLLLSLPLLARALPAPTVVAQLDTLQAPQQALRTEDYTAFVRFGVPPGTYRAVLTSCQVTCATVDSTPFTATAQEAPMLRLSGPLRPLPTQDLELRLYPGEASFGSRPLGRYRWTVEVRR